MKLVTSLWPFFLVRFALSLNKIELGTDCSEWKKKNAKDDVSLSKSLKELLQISQTGKNTLGKPISFK